MGIEMNSLETLNQTFDKEDLGIKVFITEMGTTITGLRRSYLTWNDLEGVYPRIEDLDLNFLGVQIVSMVNGSLGHGWIFYLPETKPAHGLSRYNTQVLNFDRIQHSN
jgi:hypothetical protein